MTDSPNPHPTAAQANAATLEREFAWLDAVLQARLALHFGQPSEVNDIRDIEAPALSADPSAYAAQVRDLGLSAGERLVLITALAPHLRPAALDLLRIKNSNLDTPFAEFGGIQSSAGFLPTLETALFLVSGSDLAQRMAAQSLLNEDSRLLHSRTLALQPIAVGEPAGSARLTLTPEALLRLTTGDVRQPGFGTNFPAQRVTTALGWSDLVLNPHAMADINTLRTWLAHSLELRQGWPALKALPPGYRALFTGPPGTGKTLAAALLGKASACDVYAIDLALLCGAPTADAQASVAHVLAEAEHRQWIVLVTGAEAAGTQLFDALWPLLERFPGLLLLETRGGPKGLAQRGALAGRIHLQVDFPVPGAEERLRLWQQLLGQQPQRLAPDVSLTAASLQALAESHLLPGGTMPHVLRHAVLAAMQSNRGSITLADLSAAITRLA